MNACAGLVAVDVVAPRNVLTSAFFMQTHLPCQHNRLHPVLADEIICPLVTPSVVQRYNIVSDGDLRDAARRLDNVARALIPKPGHDYVPRPLSWLGQSYGEPRSEGFLDWGKHFATTQD